jgi:hypothetical protein
VTTAAQRGYRPVLLLADDATARLIESRLAHQPGWVVPRPRLDLPGGFGRLLWGYESGDGSAGVSALAHRGRFETAVRRLADRLVAPWTAGIASNVLDVCTDGPRLAPLLRMAWPDAVVVGVVRDGDENQLASAAPDLVLSAAAVADAPDRAAARIAAVAGAPPAAAPAAAEPPVTGRLAGRLIVILGAARSGTTWTHRMLSAHPQVAGIETGETWLFPDVAPLWADKVRQSAGERVVTAALREFCDELLVALRDRTTGATHVSEKTPATVWRLPMMARVYPDAYYVHVVRDGRDAVLSMARSGFASGDLAAAARTWVDAVTRVRAGQQSFERFREIRYEDLLDDPMALIQDTWEWIGLPQSAVATAELAERVYERVTPLAPVGDIGTGKWQLLGAEDRRAIEAVAGPLLAELGYPDGG